MCWRPGRALASWPSSCDSAWLTGSSGAIAGSPIARQRLSSVRRTRGIDQREQHQPRILRDLLEDAIEMRLAAHHRPEVSQRLHVVILGERGLGDILQRLAGRIGEEVEMEPHQRAGALVENMGIGASATHGMGQAPAAVRNRPSLIHNAIPSRRLRSTDCGLRGCGERLRSALRLHPSQAVGRSGPSA